MERALALAEEQRLEEERARRREERAIKRSIKLEEEERSNKGYEGKLELVKENELFKFKLKASNGELLCSSEGYTTKNGCKTGAENFAKSVMNGKYDIYEVKSGSFQPKFYTDNGRLIVVGETYASKQSALNAVESIKRFVQTAKPVDTTKNDGAAGAQKEAAATDENK